MTVACIIIKNLPWRVELDRNSRLRRAPLVIYDVGSPLRRVVDSTPGSRVHASMPLATARARCPDANVVPADHGVYHQRWQAIVARLRGVCEPVEDDGQGTAYAHIDADGEPLADEPRTVASLMDCIPTEWEPRAGVASDRYAAHAAASIARPDRALRVPDAAELRFRFLAPLPIDLLPLDIPTLSALRDRGIHRLGQLDDLSPDALEMISAGSRGTAAMWEPDPQIPWAA